MFFHVAIQQSFINKVGAFIWYPEGGRLTELSFENDFMIFSCLLTNYYGALTRRRRQR